MRPARHGEGLDYFGTETTGASLRARLYARFRASSWEFPSFASSLRICSRVICTHSSPRFMVVESAIDRMPTSSGTGTGSAEPRGAWAEPEAPLETWQAEAEREGYLERRRTVSRRRFYALLLELTAWRHGRSGGQAYFDAQ